MRILTARRGQQSGVIVIPRPAQPGRLAKFRKGLSVAVLGFGKGAIDIKKSALQHCQSGLAIAAIFSTVDLRDFEPETAAEHRRSLRQAQSAPAAAPQAGRGRVYAAVNLDVNSTVSPIISRKRRILPVISMNFFCNTETGVYVITQTRSAISKQMWNRLAGCRGSARHPLLFPAARICLASASVNMRPCLDMYRTECRFQHRHRHQYRRQRRYHQMHGPSPFSHDCGRL